MNKSKTICFIYTEINDDINNYDYTEDTSKKTLFNFGRLLYINYEIGYRENDKFVSIKKEKKIVKPRCMVINNKSFNYENNINKEGIEIEDLLTILIKDLINVSIIVTYDVNFNFKTILGEYIRYNKYFSFNKYINIDIKSFYHKLDNPSLEYLYLYNYPKRKKSISQLEMIKESFFKLYNDYEKSIK